MASRSKVPPASEWLSCPVPSQGLPSVHLVKSYACDATLHPHIPLPVPSVYRSGK